jgi:Alpha-L-arabinofuranosidase C-terminal domain
MDAISCLGCAAEPRGIFQGISFHHYTHAGNGIAKESATEFSDQQYYATMAHAADIDRVIAGHSAVMDSDDPRRRIGLVCDEWGTWWRDNPRFLYQQNTLRDALVAGLHFDIFRARGPAPDGQHRPDNQRATGDDPDRRARRSGADERSSSAAPAAIRYSLFSPWFGETSTWPAQVGDLQRAQ